MASCDATCQWLRALEVAYGIGKPRPTILSVDEPFRYSLVLEGVRSFLGNTLGVAYSVACSTMVVVTIVTIVML